MRGVMRPSREEIAVGGLFLKPFKTASPLHATNAFNAHLMADVVVHQEAGLRLEYTSATANWLTQVLQAPDDFGLVYNFLHSILVTPSQPLGGLGRRFADLMQRLHGSKSILSAVMATMVMGCERLHRLTLDVYPPLQCSLQSQAAAEAVQAALFEVCAPTINAAVAHAATVEDNELTARLATLGNRLQLRHLELPRHCWLEDVASPYASAIEYVRSLPTFAAPRQKLQVLADACTEAARCVACQEKQSQHQPRATVSAPAPSCHGDHNEDYPVLHRVAGRDSGAQPDGPPPPYLRSMRSSEGLRVLSERLEGIERLSNSDGAMRRLPSWQVGRSPTRQGSFVSAAADASGGGGGGMPRLPSWSCPAEVAAAAAATAAAEAAVARAAEQKKEDDMFEEAVIDEAANMAADELIPVMAYVLARAQIGDSLVCELRLLEAFLMAEERLMLGRLGYGLATFQAAMALLASEEMLPLDSLGAPLQPQTAPRLSLVSSRPMMPAVNGVAVPRPLPPIPGTPLGGTPNADAATLVEAPPPLDLPQALQVEATVVSPPSASKDEKRGKKSYKIHREHDKDDALQPPKQVLVEASVVETAPKSQRACFSGGLRWSSDDFDSFEEGRLPGVRPFLVSSMQMRSVDSLHLATMTGHVGDVIPF